MVHVSSFSHTVPFCFLDLQNKVLLFACYWNLYWLFRPNKGWKFTCIELFVLEISCHVGCSSKASFCYLVGFIINSSIPGTISLSIDTQKIETQEFLLTTSLREFFILQS